MINSPSLFNSIILALGANPMYIIWSVPSKFSRLCLRSSLSMTTVNSLASVASAATIHPNEHQINLPELPEEILEEIFRWACDVNSPIQDAPRLLSFPVPWNERALRRRRAFRRSIILVCKTWHRIVLPYLFESVVILDQRGSQCQGLLDVLEKYSFGHLVTRLDLSLQSPHSGGNSLKALGKALGSLLRHCTNLRVVTVKLNHFGLNRGFLDRLLQCILALPNLQILDFPWFNCRADFVATLANSTIRATSFFPSATVACLPALSQICISDSSMSTPFENVTSLIFNVIFTSRRPYLSELISNCRLLPRLRYVTIRLASVEKHNRCLVSLSFPKTPSNLQLPPSVHTLGFWFDQPKATNSNWRNFCWTMAAIRGEGIKVLCFRAETAEDLRSRPHAYEMMNETLRIKGWRLETDNLYV
ncbi:hypothetical protein BDP27DRAFT_728157 [Rhodocollybia butyracea]|uniref:F-box domain-containing protein n=1 Tax=Rhodocollybia butyracea TaxID=206335 RepID=A0A9P5TW91_9AGAR|nr:hypothetical protein BDP27DRAFT_728157 [Rhodocollybia butyracea]